MPSLAVIVILAFATYRLARLCTSDSITLAAREAIWRWAWNDDPAAMRAAAERGDAELKPVPRAGGFRTWIHALVTCDQCLGVWWGIAVYCAWRWGGDVSLGIITVAALLGVQSLVAWGAHSAEAWIDVCEKVDE
jgi:hypothetical protein